MDQFSTYLQQLRHMLENVWDHETILPGDMRQENEPISKGQCAVTCYYLAQELLQIGCDVLFCKGDVIFDDAVPPIINHRWLKYQDRIIDLTADQTGYGQSVIVAHATDLQKQGVCYKTKWEKPLSAIENKACLFERAEILRQKINQQQP